MAENLLDCWKSSFFYVYVLRVSVTTSPDSDYSTVAMLHYPHVIKKAQAEIDRVIGQDRLPEFSDKEHLPYIQAVANETLRWRPVAVLGGTPHAVIEDDEYNGL